MSTERSIATIGNRLAPARFLIFLALLPVGYFTARALLPVEGGRDAAVLAFDSAALVLLVSLVPLFRRGDADAMRRHSQQNDANRLWVLALTTLLTLAAMAAITGEIEGARAGNWWSIAKLVVTLLLIWLVANSVYALHYAHSWYAPADSGDARGLEFPGTTTPDYWDFAYFSFTLGMTFQTSDIQIRSAAMRKVALFHGFAAFVFNIGVITFTINALGGP